MSYLFAAFDLAVAVLFLAAADVLAAAWVPDPSLVVWSSTSASAASF